MPVWLEKDIEQSVKRWAKAHHILTLKMKGLAGYPDDLFLYKGRCAFIEFKRPGGKPEPLQVYRIEQLRNDGFTVGVVDNVRDGITFLEATFFSRTSS